MSFKLEALTSRFNPQYYHKLELGSALVQKQTKINKEKTINYNNLHLPHISLRKC